MRNLIFAINITLDGCCDHTKTVGSEEILEHYTRLLREVDLFVYGRKTYQLMVPYWPNVAKNQSETKHRSNLQKRLSPKTKLFFPNR
jgi:dihydrofolate reductase